MADDKTKKDYHDKTRINMNEKYEVDYWRRSSVYHDKHSLERSGQSAPL